MRPIGPLATFDGAVSRVVHPYKNGVALIGDAAASSDPSYGQGQGLTLRDARVLRDQLLAHDDWHAAADSYAAEHDRYFAWIDTFTSWVYKLFYDRTRCRRTPNSCAAAAAEDLSSMPDAIFSGPEVTLDETARKRFFGEE